MKLVIRARALELTSDLRDAVTRRIGFALSRLASAIDAVDVTLADINGPRGGLDKVCRIRVRGPGLPAIVIEETHADIRAASDAAAARAGRTVLRAIQRRRSFGPGAEAAS